MHLKIKKMAKEQDKRKIKTKSKVAPKKHEGDFSKFIKKELPPKQEEEKPERVVKVRKTSPKQDTTIHIEKDGTMRLNKYIAHSGICSRRDADTLIQDGRIKVNGETITELGFKVERHDKVYMDGKRLVAEKLQYVLLNKPKGYVTTTEDPQERKIVMDLIHNACEERVYPVGRLDRNTTGLLLFTNDGDLVKKLTHPKHRIRKVYHVFLDKPLTKNDMQTIMDGFDLEDGPILVDKISYVEDVESKMEIGVQIHSGRNRIIRRIFEHLEYEVIKLDRVIFGSLTKKDLPRGRWRHLTKDEVDFLKMI